MAQWVSAVSGPEHDPMTPLYQASCARYSSLLITLADHLFVIFNQLGKDQIASFILFGSSRDRSQVGLHWVNQHGTCQLWKYLIGSMERPCFPLRNISSADKIRLSVARISIVHNNNNN